MEPDDQPLTLLDALRAELRAYEAERTAFAAKKDVDAAYRAGVLHMWAHAIGVKRAQVEREEGRLPGDNSPSPVVVEPLYPISGRRTPQDATQTW